MKHPLPPGRAHLRVVCVLALLTPACLSDRGPEEPEPERIEADLVHWSGDPAFWSARDGVLIGESTEDNPCTRTTYLVWKGEELRDFELTLQYRIQGGNSGIQFRSEEVAPWDVHGYQADFDAANQWTGCLYEQGGRGVIATRGDRVVDDGTKKNVMRPKGEEHGSALTVAEPPGWNDNRSRAVGERIELAVNGVVTTVFVDRSPAATRSGVLALQLHQGPPMRVEFRNLVLRRIRATHPLAPEAATEDEDDWLEPRQWIWTEAPDEDEEIWARRSFTLPEGFERAHLWATCDNVMQVFLNGDELFVSESWASPVALDVTDRLRAGANQLCIWGRNDDGPSGLVAELTVAGAGEEGDALRLITDESWAVTNADPGPDWVLVADDPSAGRDGWTRANELAPYGSQPWGMLGEGSAPSPSRALDAAAIELPPGFEAELVYSVPRLRQGSWVSLCAAPGNRLYASDQYGGLFRVTPGEDGERVLVEPVEVELGRAHGLLWAFDALYVVVSEGGGAGKGLYRVSDTDGDDALDRVEELAQFDGSGEHGPHAVVLGPDNESLYLVGGNHTSLPEIARSRVPEVWDEDVLLPRLEDPNGHAVGKRAPGGWVVKTDRDATEFELIAIGFRNAYDLAFDANGELFTFDSDMEWDTGLPWYRPTRILHVTSGADFGWRSGSGKWPESYPDSLPAVVDIGLSSPTGVALGRGAGFPRAYEDALFAADWAYGTIYAVTIEPDGASYRGVAQTFAHGEPLPVTDLAVLDGALYFTTGGRRAQSGLYRVRFVGTSDPAIVRSSVPEEVDLRAALEARHARASAADVGMAWAALAHPDRHVRFAARTLLERIDLVHWRTRALQEGDVRASIQALLALVRCDATLTSGELAQRVASWHWEALDDEVRNDALRVVGLGLLRVPGFEEDVRDLAERLLALAPTGHDSSDHEFARLFGRLDLPGALPKVLALLDGAQTQEEAIHYAYAASFLTHGWDGASRARLLSWFDAESEAFEGGVSFRQYLDAMREEAIRSMGDSFVVEAALASGDDVGRYAPLRGEALAFVSDYTTDDLAPALERLDAGRDFARGKHLYRQTSCLQCHRIAGDGGGTGPDLTGVASRYSPRDLLESLLEPSATVSDQYRDEEVWLANGSVTVGRVVSDQDGVVVVREASGTRVTIDAGDIELRREHPLSRMPEGLLDVLSEEDVLDLLAYVLAGGDEEDPAFAADAR